MNVFRLVAGDPGLALWISGAGLLLLIAEFLKPGLIWPGVVGSAALITGSESLPLIPSTFEGLLIAGLGATLAGIQAPVPTRVGLVSLASVCTWYGFRAIPGVGISSATFVTIVLISGAAVLAPAAMRARRNKRCWNAMDSDR